VERVRGWLQRAMAELDMPVRTARDEDAWAAYANLLSQLSEFGRQPREATERMKLLYSEVSDQVPVGRPVEANNRSAWSCARPSRAYGAFFCTLFSAA
jgi:hypothetical protein